MGDAQSQQENFGFKASLDLHKSIKENMDENDNG
jgi:hypothetical protein